MALKEGWIIINSFCLVVEAKSEKNVKERKAPLSCLLLLCFLICLFRLLFRLLDLLVLRAVVDDADVA